MSGVTARDASTRTARCTVPRIKYDARLARADHTESGGERTYTNGARSAARATNGTGDGGTRARPLPLTLGFGPFSLFLPFTSRAAPR